MSFATELRKSIISMVLFSIILGGLYPLAMTGLGKVFFAAKTQGSLVVNAQGQVIGSSLIGQNFQNPKYFLSRPSAASPAYNALSSGGSNLSPTHPQLIATLKTRIAAMQRANPDQPQPVPVDLVTASASGLDPDISPAAAYYQAPRIAKLRNLSLAQVNELITHNVTQQQVGILGEPRVNVLKLNMALDGMAK